LDGFPWDRQAVSAHLGALAAHTTGVQVRGGVIPAVGDPLKLIPTSGLSFTVKAGDYLLPTAAVDGPVLVSLRSDTVLTSDTAAANPRIDRVIVEVADVGTTSSTGVVRIVKGVAASSPAVPSTNWTTPGGAGTALGNGGWAPLGYFTIGGGASSLGAYTDERVFTAAAGGVVRVANWAAAAALPPGTPFVTLDTETPGLVRAAGATPPEAAPVVYDSRDDNTYTGDDGPSPNFTNTTPGGYTTATWTFTPTRTGYATVTAEWDAQSQTSGWGSVSIYLKAGGVLLDSGAMMIESGIARTTGRFTAAKPVLLTGGVSVQLTVEINAFSAAGSWRFNTFRWIVAQR
jgi:hypothetical protein